MREIKFRGKRVSDGVWVYGDLLTQYPHHHGATIVEHGCIHAEVDPATVGQSTGLFDKNGREIYGGDIARYGVNYERINKIVYEQGCFQLQGNGGLAPLRYHHLLDSNTPDIEVISNIHDDPELLE